MTGTGRPPWHHLVQSLALVERDLVHARQHARVVGFLDQATAGWRDNLASGWGTDVSDEHQLYALLVGALQPLNISGALPPFAAPWLTIAVRSVVSHLMAFLPADVLAEVRAAVTS